MNKHFHGFLVGISVLPALLVMPAVAVEIDDDINLNSTFSDGILLERVNAIYGKTGTLSVDNIDININENEKVRAIQAWYDDSKVFLGGDTTQTIKLSDTKEGGYGAVAGPGSYINLKSRDITVIGNNGGLYTYQGAIDVVASNDVNVSASDAIHAYENASISVKANNLTVDGVDTGLMANYRKGQITVEATGDVNISAQDSAIHAGFGTADLTKAKEDTSFVDIKAKNINLTATETGIEAMSNGWIDLDGNLTVNAKNAILARGYATVNVNESGKNTVKMDGDMNFNFYSNPGSSGNSNSPIDAYVNINLTDAQSYWTGNTLVEYYYADEPAESVLAVNNFRLSLSNGAVWNATKITNEQTVVVDDETGLDVTSGKYYIALNNLNIDNGTVNIADMDRGIIVENATIADATFNGGKLNIGEMTLTSGTSVFNNDVAGVSASSVLTVDSGATMNIGTNNVNVNTITLNGTMLATVRSGDDAQITATTKFDGDGELKLSFSDAGTYKVFGGKIFDNVDVSSSVYDLNWNEGTLVVTQKSVEDIASDNNLSTETATAISGLMTSTSETLNDLAVVIQEKLASGTDVERAEVEHAQAAIHPETQSVVQSVSSSVQNTVTSLAAGRMSMPTVGRNGGDVKMTSGGVWAQGIFNKSKHSDAFNGYTRGIAAGLDGTLDKVWTIGAGYAFAHSDISGTARDTEIDSSSVFVYGQYKPSAWYMNLVANYTMADYTETGAALGTGISAKYDVDSFGANIATGYDFVGGITPELGLRYMHINSSDYINSLGIKNELADADYLTASLGTKYAFDIKATKRFTLRPELNYAVKYDMLSDKQVATVTMPGVNAYALNGERLSRIAGEFGIGLTMNYRGLDLSLNYDIEAREDYTSQSGRVKFRYNF